MDSFSSPFHRHPQWPATQKGQAAQSAKYRVWGCNLHSETEHLPEIWIVCRSPECARWLAPHGLIWQQERPCRLQLLWCWQTIWAHRRQRHEYSVVGSYQENEEINEIEVIISSKNKTKKTAIEKNKAKTKDESKKNEKQDANKEKRIVLVKTIKWNFSAVQN